MNLPVQSPSQVLVIYGPGAIYTDISKRLAHCQVCSGPILKQTRRVVHITRLTQPRQMRNGGVITGQKKFYHPECLTAQLMTADVFPRWRPGFCIDCGQSAEDGRRAGWAVISSRSPWVHVCHACSELPRWKQCLLCEIFHPSHMISKVGGQSLPSAYYSARQTEGGPQRLHPYVCNHCVNEFGFTTQADEIRQRRSDSRLRERFERVRDQLEADGGL